MRPRIYAVTFRSIVIKYYYMLFCGEPYSPTRPFRQSLKYNRVLSRLDVRTDMHPHTPTRTIYLNRLNWTVVQRIYSLIFAKCRFAKRSTHFLVLLVIAQEVYGNN